jgi:colanic acid/amylovoran biosynthesis glycosyltransferase
MKVLFCSHDELNYVGGPNTWLCRLLPELDGKGIDVHVALITSSHGSGSTYRTLKDLGIRCYEISLRAAPFVHQQVIRILALTKEIAPDVFIPNLMIPAYYAIKWIRESCIPTISVLHSDDPFYRALVEEFVNGSEPYRVSSVVCVSNYLESMLQRVHKGAVGIARIPCGSPVPESHASTPEGLLRIVYVGRLEQEQKRIIDVVRSLCRTVSQIPGVEAHIFGDGRAKGAVERLIATEGRGLPVFFKGRVNSNEIQRHLLDAHVTTLLSDYEGLPIALMEAMACGVVPICLETRSGIPELVEHNVTGLIVQDRQASFIEAVRTLRKDEELWKRLSSASRNRIQESYSNHKCAQQWFEHLHEMVSKSPPRKPFAVPRLIQLPASRKEFTHQDLRYSPATFHMFRRLLEIYAPEVALRIYKKVRRQ